jgi:DnaJ-class molecular chaperone
MFHDFQVHPDKCAHRDAHEAFQLVQEAYESLASPTERAKYDQFLVRMRAKRWRRVREKESHFHCT